jgi:hypothetical protein
MRRIAARAVILAGAVALSVPVVRGGLATAVVRRDPAAALAFAADARTEISAADALMAAGERVDSPRMRRLVETVLARDVTIPAAIEYRGLQAHAAGDGVSEARLFRLSNAISRRSLATRLWFIQSAVDRGDVAGALEHFDLALRTSSAAPKLLFPVLANAATDAGLVRPIAAILDRPNDWRVLFLEATIRDGARVDALADVLAAMRDRAMILANGIDRALATKLAEQGAFAKAAAVEAHFHPGPHALLRDPRFADVRAAPPFGWALTNDGQIAAERSRVAGVTALAVHAQPLAAGQAAAQLLLLLPGRYRLATRMAEGLADTMSPPSWSLACGEGARQQLAVLPLSAAAGTTATVDFAVPEGCAGQWLTLQILASDAPEGQVAAIGWISVARR